MTKKKEICCEATPEEYGLLSASAEEVTGISEKDLDDLLMSKTQLENLKDEIQALKGELRLKNEEIDELHRIIGEMYVQNKNGQPLP